MKILEIFGEPIANGGQESFVINVLKAIDLTNLQIDLLTPYDCENNFYKSIVESKGGKVFEFGIAFTPGRSRKNIYKSLLKFLKENNYDVVHVHSGSISVLMYAAKAASKAKVKKIIVHSHCAAERKTLKYRAVKLMSLLPMKKYPTHYCACSQIAGEWKFSKSIVRKKLIILKNGVDIKEFSFKNALRKNIRNKSGISQDDFVVGHVGRFSYQKNHEYLLKIFKELKRISPNSKLMLIGSGELYDEVKEQAKRGGISNDVILVGNVDNVADYMQAMDVFVLPSRFEGLPIVGVEAQAAGLPVITSVNVSRELNICRNVSFLELSEDISVWVDEIRKYINAPRLDNSNTLVDSGYDIKSTAEKIRNIYL